MTKAITSIADLTPDSVNARLHNPRNIGMIVSALHQVGAARSIVIDEQGMILAGHGVIEAAAEAGIEKVQVVDADGETIIAVRRTGLTDEQKVKLALYDNRTAELATWNPEQLVADLDAGLDLGDMWSPYELGKLGLDVDVPPFDPADEWQGMPEFEQEDLTSFQSIHVHFQNQEGIDEFAALIGQKVGPKTRAIWYPEVPKIDMKSELYTNES
jgi:hypothetical protein